MEIMENRGQDRKIVDIGLYPLLSQFILGDEKYFEGKIWDISKTGLGIIVSSENYEEVFPKMSGTLHIWKVPGKFVDIPATCMWADKSYGIRFYGFQTDVNLYETELRQYLE